MEETLIPDWIQQIKNEDDLREARRETREQREAAARSLIRANGVEFWKQILEKLDICVRGLEKLNIRGSLTKTGDVRAEQSCRVYVAAKGVIPNQTYTDLHYSQGSLQIRRIAMEEPLPFLDLCVVEENRIAAVSDEHPRPMDADDTARLITERMVKIVRQG